MVCHECVIFHLRQRVVVGMGGNSSLEEVCVHHVIALFVGFTT